MGCQGLSSSCTLPSQSNAAGKLGWAWIQNSPKIIFFLTYRMGSGWDTRHCVPSIAKMGLWTDGAILTHKPSLQTSQKLDFHVIQSPPAPQQRMLCCQGARTRMRAAGAHPVPAASDTTYQPQSYSCIKGTSQKMVGNAIFPMRGKPRGCQTKHLCCRVLCRGRGALSQPCQTCTTSRPRSCEQCLELWYPLCASLLSFPQLHLPGPGDQTSAPSHRECVWPSCKGDQINDKHRMKRLCSTCYQFY